ncbi:MerR family transcriptional regulator [Notoacmeibacter sp. MSK16QG-6]|uniref:MerR family transcriptional regulator n=1 Tax=Notoacmeibacter sp. MSK16QG-6 TaxID=2957982 RepID=UPI00209E7060|nr:MerR family transcriptional regulator [Notoacmeibacter sp. MSK16QG-6]MCP1198446.1 MerR family transcriptional regulator [Notoacmeibacter sp. MSK16QG-6]
MADKAADAFRTISEVADDLDLPQHVLRFWETRFNQIRPMKRGGGRRYYRPQDVDLIRGIRHLLYDEGYTIKGVQKILKESGVGQVAAIGAGDSDALQAVAARKAQVANDRGRSPAAKAADPLLGEARGGARRSGDKEDGAGEGVMALSGNHRNLLQEALFDLLECKRLLDQAR